MEEQEKKEEEQRIESLANSEDSEKQEVKALQGQKAAASKGFLSGLMARFQLSQDQVNALLLVFIVGVAFLVAGRFPLRLDVTESNIHTLSKASQALVSDLQDPLRVRVFLSTNLPPPLNDLQTSIGDLLGEYADVANNNFSYTIYEVSGAKTDLSPRLRENLELAESYGIAPQQVQTIEKDEVKLISAYLSLVIEYGNLVERVNVLNSVDALEYSVSSIIERLSEKINGLVGLEENIKLTVFLNDAFVEASPFFGINNLSALPGFVEDLAAELNKQNYDRLSYEYRQNITDGEKLQLQETKDIQLYPWNAFQVKGKSYPANKGIAVLEVAKGDDMRYIELLHAQRALKITQQGFVEDIEYHLIEREELEFLLTAAIEGQLNLNQSIAYLNEGDTFDLGLDPSRSQLGAPGLGAAAGGEQAAPGTSFAALLSERYTIDPVDFESLDPRRYASLLLLSPKKELSQWQLYKIDSYLMNGGSLIVFHDLFNEVSQNFPGQVGGSQGIPRWMQNPSGLEKLIEHYGLKINASVVMDKNSFVSQRRLANGSIEQQKVYFAPLIQNTNINTNVPFMKGIRGFAVIGASPLSLVEETIEKNSIRAYELFSSSDQSWETEGEVSLVPFLIQEPSDESKFQPYPLAYVLEGSFESYFLGKEIPSKTEEPSAGEAASANQGNNDNDNNNNKQSFTDDKVEAKERSPETSRIFIMASSQMLGNNIIDPNGRQPNAILVQNIVDYINGEGDWAIMRSKGQRVNPLDLVRGEESGSVPFFQRPTFIKTFNIAALPIFAILLGIWMYFYQLRVSSRIRLAFNAASVTEDTTKTDADIINKQ